MPETSEAVHKYERDGLLEQIRESLTRAGLGDKQLTLSDLAPLDQFHSRGFEATTELAEALTITSESKVLDIGSGLGGPARYLASKFGCHVKGIDLTQSFVDAAQYLTERTGLADKVSFECADALALPFADSSFDIVWTQHVAMNIANRSRLYSEAFRVLKTGGQLGAYDVVAGPNGPVHFPVPWSSVAETSFLVSPDQMKTLVANAGFSIVSVVDHTAAGVAWFADLQKRTGPSAAPPVVGLNLVVGPDFAARAANLGRSLQEGRAGLLQVVAQRPE